MGRLSKNLLKGRHSAVSTTSFHTDMDSCSNTNCTCVDCQCGTQCSPSCGMNTLGSDCNCGPNCKCGSNCKCGPNCQCGKKSACISESCETTEETGCTRVGCTCVNCTCSACTCGSNVM